MGSKKYKQCSLADRCYFSRIFKTSYTAWASTQQEARQQNNKSVLKRLQAENWLKPQKQTTGTLSESTKTLPVGMSFKILRYLWTLTRIKVQYHLFWHKSLQIDSLPTSTNLKTKRQCKGSRNCGHRRETRRSQAKNFLIPDINYTKSALRPIW